MFSSVEWAEINDIASGAPQCVSGGFQQDGALQNLDEKVLLNFPHVQAPPALEGTMAMIWGNSDTLEVVGVYVPAKRCRQVRHTLKSLVDLTNAVIKANTSPERGRSHQFMMCRKKRVAAAVAQQAVDSASESVAHALRSCYADFVATNERAVPTTFVKKEHGFVRPAARVGLENSPQAIFPETGSSPGGSSPVDSSSPAQKHDASKGAFEFSFHGIEHPRPLSSPGEVEAAIVGCFSVSYDQKVPRAFFCGHLLDMPEGLFLSTSSASHPIGAFQNSVMAKVRTSLNCMREDEQVGSSIWRSDKCAPPACRTSSPKAGDESTLLTLCDLNRNLDSAALGSRQVSGILDFPAHRSGGDLGFWCIFEQALFIQNHHHDYHLMIRREPPCRKNTRPSVPSCRRIVIRRESLCRQDLSSCRKNTRKERKKTTDVIAGEASGFVKQLSHFTG